MFRSLSVPARYTFPAIALAGALYATGYSPLGWWPVSVLCLAYAFREIAAAAPGKAFRLGFLFTLTHTLAALHWLPMSFYVDSGGSIWPLLYAGIPSLVGISAIFGALHGGAAWLVMRITPEIFPARLMHVARLLLLAVVWLGIEALRTLPPFTFPWQPVGAIFAGSLSILQLAAIGSIYLLSAFGLALAVCIASHRRYGIALAAVLATVTWGWGAWRLADAPQSLPVLTTVRLVQPSIPTILHWHRTGHPELLPRHITNSLTQAPEVSAIIWPETALSEPVAFDSEFRAGLGSILKPGQSLVLGFLDYSKAPDQTWQAHNAVGTITSSGEVQSLYHKQILVPFGEAIPFPSITNRILKPLALSRGSYVRGETPVSLAIGTYTALPLICYEGIFSGYVRKNIKPEHDFILNITNDSWFDGTVGPWQHLALGRIRAIETGLSFVRVGNTGISGIWDGYGRTIQMLPPESIVGQNIHIPKKIATR